MNQHAEVPIPPELSRRYRGSVNGRDWLASIPRLISRCLDQWRLELDLTAGTLPWTGHGAIVVPVCRGRDADKKGGGSEAAALKIAYPHGEALVERHALTLWAGHGAVRLLAADAGALLLERLDAARSLQDAPLDTAVPAWGAVMRRLSLVPDDKPEWRAFDHVAARAEQWSDELPETWEQLARPFPRWLLEAALEVCQTRGAVGRRSAKDVLVHTDLHYLNILARPDSADGPEPAGVEDFAAIDPQPMIGEAEFAVAPLLWNRLRELDRSGPQRALLERCREFSAAAGLDAETARQWALAREVDNALRYASRRHHDGDLARSLWVASTLAGRTLPGLPAPQELPEPGMAGAERVADQR
ncbi:aminoglycoside resistance protein [Arthrobacter sp. PAMC25564]|uniref:aminoglycoside phosphotransferase family protein n=1 Tax=Arthrobacter sp. PAMC25564 TaxID=2565366 RepID=UPI0010A23820|nr:aminoglycoside phosphotransferase family protein [Arthrobacter sp. PAMC25564]QCB98309.1 aminoglycoside resistance protein [Arthrobacter sp. PAMC25564]